MEIKSYKKLRGNLYQVTMDDGKSYKLYDDIILRYELLVLKQVDDKKLTCILRDNEKMEAYFKALKYIGVRMRSKVELMDYLKKQGFDEETIDKTIEELEKQGYLNMQAYAEAFVNDAINLGQSGPLKIMNDLIKLGIEKTIVSSHLDKFSTELWRERIEKYIKKKLKTNRYSEIVFKNKMYNELRLLGYDSEDINVVLDSVDIDTSEAFKKEADKVYNRLANKYEKEDLKRQFKTKMYQKGFLMEHICQYLEERSV